MGTTTGELGLTTYSAGDEPWSHSSGLATIDSKVSDLMHGKMRDAVTVSSLASQPDLTSGQKGAAVLDVSATSGTLSQLTNGTDEQFIYLYFSGATCPTVEHGTDADDISLRGAADFSPAQHDWICLWYDGDNSIWREVWRSPAYLTALIGQSDLSTTTQSGTLNNTQTVSYTGGEYSLSPKCYSATGAYGVFGGAAPGGLFNVSGLNSLSYTIRYFQSSPPWQVAGELWGSFLYLHRDKSSGEILASSLAEDPHWYQGGASPYAKNDVRRIASNPHPFSFWDAASESFTKTPPAGTEIVLVDMRSVDLVEDSFDSRLERAKVFREGAESLRGASAVSLIREAEELESKAVPTPAFAYRTRAAKASVRGKTAWDLVKDLPEVVNASSQAKKNGKPIKLGDKSIDKQITIVSAG